MPSEGLYPLDFGLSADSAQRSEDLQRYLGEVATVKGMGVTGDTPSVISGSVATVNINVTEFQSTGYIQGATTQELVVQYAGVYAVTANVVFTGTGASTARFVGVFKNTSDEVVGQLQPSVTSDNDRLSCTRDVSLVEGDLLSLALLQRSGSLLTIINYHLSVVYRGAQA